MLQDDGPLKLPPAQNEEMKEASLQVRVCQAGLCGNGSPISVEIMQSEGDSSFISHRHTETYMCMEMCLDVCQQTWLLAFLKSFFWVASGLLGKVKTVNAPTM